MLEAELEFDARATLGEGPCWDAGAQRLYWVDIEQNRLHSYDPATGRDQAIDVGQRIGVAVKRQAGGLVLGLKSGFYAFDPATAALEPLALPEAHLPGNRFNDGKCDPAGRFWAGSLPLAEDHPGGSLYCLDVDLTVTRKIENITVSNGLAWSGDHRTMYFIDSPTRVVEAFDYDPATGAIANRRTVISIPGGWGYPDGMTINAENMLWVALWDGWAVTRWNPATGELIDKLALPVARVTSCAFGGPELDTLYITSARSRLSPEQLARQPLAGALFRCRPGVRGLEAWEFAG